MGQASVNYKDVLDDLRARRAKLDAVIAAVEEMVGDETGVQSHVSITATPATARVMISGIYSSMTIAAAAIHFLKSAGKPQGTIEIVNALRRGGTRTASKNLYRTVYNSLNIRRDKGEIVKKGAKWGLAEWQQQENPR